MNNKLLYRESDNEATDGLLIWKYLRYENHKEIYREYNGPYRDVKIFI